MEEKSRKGLLVIVLLSLFEIPLWKLQEFDFYFSL